MPDIDPGPLDPNQTQKPLPDGQVLEYKIVRPLTPLEQAQERLTSLVAKKTEQEKIPQIKSYTNLLKQIERAQIEIEQLTPQ